MKYATGYKLDPVGHTRTPFFRLAERKGLVGAPLPASASIAFFAPPVFNQNGTSSCTGAAIAGATYTALAAAGRALPWIPSPGSVYRNGRAVDRVPNADGTYAPLTDDGANANQVERGIAEWGVRRMGPSVLGLNYDIDTSNVNDEPKLGEVEDESVTLVIGSHGVTSRGAQRVAELRTAIAAGFAFTAAIAGGCDAFQSYTGGVLPALNAELDHYVWFHGYETTPAGLVIFKGRNSWDVDWGEGGDFRISPDALDELGDVIVQDVAVKGAS